MPSALFIPQRLPSQTLLRSGQARASYEYEVVNYTPALNGTTLRIPPVTALFPLATGSSLPVALAGSTLRITGGGWSGPITNSTRAGENLSFASTSPPQLLTNGWLPNDTIADAVEASAPYGALTLAFRWQWSLTEPNGTLYRSPWSVPARNATAPYLPSIFEPAPLVTSSSLTSPIQFGRGFVDTLAGSVAGRSFTYRWDDPSGDHLARGAATGPSGAQSVAASLPLVSPAHRLSPGLFVFRVLDSCGALVQDLWLNASFASSASEQIRVAPSTCGSIILNGVVYPGGASVKVDPSTTSLSLTSTGCAGYAFTGWSASGGLRPADVWARNTRLFVSWNGSLTAGWAPAHAVTFRESGAKAGQNWSVAIRGVTLVAAAPHPIQFQLANGTYPFYVNNGTGYAAAGAPGPVVVRGAAVNRSIALVPAIQHVVLIVMENSNLWPTLRDAPYMGYLWNTYARATEFYGACHESKPEYMAMTSGRPYSCTSIPVENVTNLGDLLQHKGFSWASYQESMNSSCDTVSSHQYFTHHDPFLWYADVVDNASRCDSHIVNSRSFNSSAANGSLPTFSLYVPNNNDDCEWTILPTCDAWLKGFLSPLLNSSRPKVQAMVAHTAFLVVFDEAETNLGYSTGGIVNSWCRSTTGENLSVCGGHLYLSVVSPFSANRQYSANATDYDLESTIEWLFGLGNDGGYDGTANFPAMTSLFDFPRNGSY